MYRILERYKAWRFRNTALLLASLFIFLALLRTSFIGSLLQNIGSLGYFGAFLGGMCFVSTFTVVPASVVLFYIAKTLNPILVALMAGVGAMTGDFLIFRFVQDKIFHELKPIFMKLGGERLTRLIDTPYFAWLAPVLGAIIIASPFPDEVGIGLMGLSHLKNWQFLAISFLLNSAGILFVITLAKVL